MTWLEQYFSALMGLKEYLSWAPQEYWDSLEPGTIEYDSWGRPQ
jgi:hypothetical protein